MPRPTRLVVAGHAHHIIHRGNNRQAIFFEDADRRFFLAALGGRSAPMTAPCTPMS
jgi:putative transposase